MSRPRQAAPISWAWAALLLALSVAGCGDLPRPFEGRPGRLGARLAQPPPARLAVAPPANALLSNAASDLFAGAVADALLAQDVPAVAHPARPGDWRLVVTADLQAGGIVPTYTVQDSRGAPQGSSHGAPVPAASWANGDPAALHQAAAQAAPQIVSLLVSIDAARKQSDPNSLYNRPARVTVADLTGAPGDGDTALARQMRLQLPMLGEMVQDSPQGADFTVTGQVRTAPGAGGTTRVEIQWIVTDAAAHELGRIVQINEVPPGTLSHYWGDVALVVAQQAAGGVKDVILKQTGGRTPAAQPPAAASQTGRKPDKPPARG